MSSIGRRRSHARRESGPGYHERRRRLLVGAAEVFQEKGFQAASINDIAERFGGDRASVYYYYGSKHEIFIDLIQEAVNEVVELAEAVAASPESAPVRLERLFVTTIDAYERHYPYMFVYIQEDMRKVPGDGSDAGARLQKLGKRYEAALHRVVDDGLSEGTLRSDVDAGMLIFALSGAINWTHRWFAPRGRFDGHQVGAEMAKIFLRGAARPGAFKPGRSVTKPVAAPNTTESASEGPPAKKAPAKKTPAKKAPAKKAPAKKAPAKKAPAKKAPAKKTPAKKAPAKKAPAKKTPAKKAPGRGAG